MPVHVPLLTTMSCVVLYGTPERNTGPVYPAGTVTIHRPRESTVTVAFVAVVEKETSVSGTAIVTILLGLKVSLIDALVKLNVEFVVVLRPTGVPTALNQM